jgi:hypothetical protein
VTIEAFVEALPAYRLGLDGGLETVLGGRPVQPPLRRRG